MPWKLWPMEMMTVFLCELEQNGSLEREGTAPFNCDSAFLHSLLLILDAIPQKEMVWPFSLRSSDPLLHLTLGPHYLTREAVKLLSVCISLDLKGRGATCPAPPHSCRLRPHTSHLIPHARTVRRLVEPCYSSFRYTGRQKFNVSICPSHQGRL